MGQSHSYQQSRASPEQNRGRSEVPLVSKRDFSSTPRESEGNLRATELENRGLPPPVTPLQLFSLRVPFNPTALTHTEQRSGKQPHPRGCSTGCDCSRTTGRSKHSPAGAQVRRPWKEDGKRYKALAFVKLLTFKALIFQSAPWQRYYNISN